MSRTGWAKITERIGWLVLIALAIVFSWVVALRIFRMLLEILGG